MLGYSIKSRSRSINEEVFYQSEISRDRRDGKGRFIPDTIRKLIERTILRDVLLLNLTLTHPHIIHTCPRKEKTEESNKILSKKGSIITTPNFVVVVQLLTQF